MKNKVIMILGEKENLGIMRETITLMNGMLDQLCAQEMQNLVLISKLRHK
jgi:hypothetical protein